ncbi:MAG: J domain-containing protein [Reyranella sp.]
MDYAVVISAIVLGLSVLATIAKFLDWFVHSDPKTMVRTTRWMLLLLVLACIPLLVVMIANQQWPAAMLIGAAMLIVPTLLKWRAIFAPLRAAFGYFRPKARPFDMEIWDEEAADDPEMVRRAAAILEAYVGKSSLVALSDGRRDAPHEDEHSLSLQEALDVLGLETGADEAAIRAAHKRLLGLVHPDHSGSAWLAKKVQQARDTLLAPSRGWLSSAGDTPAPRNRATKR